MKALYIGQYSYGTTSRMRGEIICQSELIKSFSYIDTNIPFTNSNKLFRTLGFRYKVGPLIKSINNYIVYNLQAREFDLIWIDKGIFITPETLKLIRSKGGKIIHYTPDTAFHQNRSKLFERGIPYYDYLITTKTFEIEEYTKFKDKNKILLTTQGFHTTIHKPYYDFSEKEVCIAFVGLNEPNREEVIQHLLNSGYNVKLAGYGWQKFVIKNKNHSLHYLGEKLVGEDYAKALSSCLFGFGALSKKFPELHTTRTFELPACGTALITEKNYETSLFYNDDDVIFYNSLSELTFKVATYIKDKKALEELIKRGKNKAQNFSYEIIINDLLDKIFS
ncbi:glycosyltransferase [Pontibacter brevis]